MVVKCPVCNTPNDADKASCGSCQARIPMRLREQALIEKRAQAAKKRDYAHGDVAHRSEARQTMTRTSNDQVGRRSDIGKRVADDDVKSPLGTA